MLGFNDPLTNGNQLSNAAIGIQQNAGVGPLSTANQTSAIGGGTFSFLGGNGSNGFLRNSDNSFNVDNIGLALGGIQTFGNLYNSFRQSRLAKEQLNLSRDAYRTNLQNSTQTYNTALEDRIRARYNTEGRSSGDAEAYLSDNRL